MPDYFIEFIIFLVFYFVFLFTKLRKKKPMEIVWWTCFLFYLFIVLTITILPPSYFYKFRYTPLSERLPYVHYSINPLPDLSLRNILSRNFFLNMVMFGPFGFLMNILFIHEKRIKKKFLWGLAFTCAIEFTQFLELFFFGMNKIPDIDDIIANTIGAMIGLVVFYIFNNLRNKIVKKKSTEASY